MPARLDADQPDSTVTEESPSENIEDKLDEVLEELKFVKTQFKDQLDKIQDQLEELKPQKTIIEEPPPHITDTIDPAEKKQETVDPFVSKQFALKHIFKEMSSLRENKHFASNSEEHFGVKWFIVIRRNNQNLACFLHCDKLETKSKWSFGMGFEIKACGSNSNNHSMKGNHCFLEKNGLGWGSFLKWDDMQKNYLIDDSLKIEIHVKITKTDGIYKENLRQFDESMKDVSDITMIVNDEKFYVSKLYLSAHSPYFKAMFLGMFGESKTSEIRLTGIDPSDFQKYLEILYGESAIDETTVEGILLVADMYDTPLVIRKCEEFLIEKSTKTLKKRLLMSVRYGLESLKKKCLEEIKTIGALRLVIPVDIDDLDPSLTALLLKKSLSFQ